MLANHDTEQLREALATGLAIVSPGLRESIGDPAELDDDALVSAIADVWAELAPKIRAVFDVMMSQAQQVFTTYQSVLDLFGLEPTHAIEGNPPQSALDRA